MNIKQAKEQIKNAMTAYFTKDDMGNYVIPIQRQRPVFLIGAPVWAIKLVLQRDEI